MTTTKPKKAKNQTTAPRTARGGEAVSPAQTRTTPQGLNMVVGQIGWQDANERIPMILLDKKTRKAFGIDEAGRVIVSKDGKSLIAIVNKQFWEYVGTNKATLNCSLATGIGATQIDDNIVVSKPTAEQEAEWERAEKEKAKAFALLMLGAFAEAHRRNSEESQGGSEE